MDVLDGFIAGIYNYCDRWCETCAFTSHCRVFADRAEEEVAPRWFLEFIDELNEAAKDLTDADLQQLEAVLTPEQEAIQQRARAYSFGTAGWLQKVEQPGERDHADPRSILAHDCALIPAKIYRALSGLRIWHAEADDFPPDHDGSAKVALLSIDRSRMAWIAAAEKGFAPTTEVEPFVAELGILGDELERVFPKARAFVRPGFDEQLTTDN